MNPSASGDKGPPAQAHLTGPDVDLRFELRNPWAPVDVVLLSGGTMITFDNWHNLGIGDVIVCYEATGKVRWSRKLEDIFDEETLERIPLSVSSRWWRQTPLEYELRVGRHPTQITLPLWDENKLSIDASRGHTSVVEVSDVGDDVERLIRRAEALRDQSKLKEANEVANRAFALDPDHMEALTLLADILSRRGAHQAVVALLGPAVERLERSDAEPHTVANLGVRLAESQLQLGSFDLAIATLERAVLVKPSYSYPINQLATVLWDAGREEEAVEALDAYLKRNQDIGDYRFVQAAATVGDFYLSRSDKQRAKEAYLLGYRTDSVTNAFLYSSLAGLLGELGENEAAITIHEQLIAYWTELGAEAFASDIKRSHKAMSQLR